MYFFFESLKSQRNIFFFRIFLVSQYALDDFFSTTDEQMSRMALMMPGRESSFSENYSLWGERLVSFFVFFSFISKNEINISK